MHVSESLVSKLRSIRRWYALFLSDGVVSDKQERKEKHTKWPPEMLKFVEAYVEDHPIFYIEELRDSISARFPLLKTTSTSTICSALNFDLNISRKVLCKAEREEIAAQIRIYKGNLLPLYSYAVQLVFPDKTSKDGRHAFRLCAWSCRNTKAIVPLSFRLGTLVRHGCVGCDWVYRMGVDGSNVFDR
ncbi:Transposase [Phytophthora megakarya]|uniref:Transposase n=1 Tax=Phytophthora megakarya TaxID=4795 RepID=A0A225VN03_9STRA|nr:Transposase [Phytophthora megakarya]